MAEAIRDGNRITVALGQSNTDSTVTLPFKIDSTTGRLLISSSGGTITLITVSGTINDSNTAFTSATEPSLLVINGGVYDDTGGAITWTYSGGNITLSSPIGTGGSIFGIA